MSEHLLLENVRIVNTRAHHQAQAFTDLIHQHGGVSIEIPFLKIEKSENCSSLQSVFDTLTPEDWVIFTSQNGVDFFLEHLKAEEVSQEKLTSVRIAVVGEKTRQHIHKLGLKESLMPNEYTGEALAHAFIRNVRKTSKVVVVRGNLAKPFLRNTLAENGYKVIDFIAYETKEWIEEEEKLLKLMRKGEIDYLTFTSSSAVRSFMTFVQKHSVTWKQLKCVCIGSVTEKTLRSYGGENILVPDRFTLDDMIQVIMRDVSQTRRNKI